MQCSDYILTCVLQCSAYRLQCVLQCSAYRLQCVLQRSDYSLQCLVQSPNLFNLFNMFTFRMFPNENQAFAEVEGGEENSISSSALTFAATERK